MNKFTKEPLFAEVHNVPDDYRFTTEELDRIIAGDMFTPRQGAIMARELQQYRVSAAKPSACIDQANLDYLESGAGADVWPASEADSDDVLLYAAPQLPQPSVVDEQYQHLSELYHSQEKRLFKIAQRIKGPSFDKYAYSPSQAIDVLESEIFGERECDGRAAMLQGAEPVQPYTLRDGWVAVPVEPTPEMNKAGWAAMNEHDAIDPTYRAMLAAAPDFREISNSSTKHFRENAETSTNTRTPSPIDHGYRPDCECSGCIATARICAELAVRSPVIPDCWCRTCRPLTVTDMRFVVFPDCGNKRCPHANDHRNACTGSNDPGQEGSAYPAAPQQEADNG